MTRPAAELVAELAPGGVLRAGINMSNGLLVTGRTPDGDPDGVAPDMARAVAERLGVRPRLVPFAKPSLVADAADQDLWDICLIGAEPARAAKIAFTDAYAEIEATYLVRADSVSRAAADVDRAGIRVVVSAGSAYGLWLERNLRHATLVLAESMADAIARFTRDGLEALAGLRTSLLTEAATLPGTRVLAGRFTAVQQAIGTRRGNAAGFAFLREFVAEAKESGLVARLIAQHGVTGLTVARGRRGRE